MNPSSFIGSSTTKDLKNFVEELKKIFEVMDVVNSERIELLAYQLKSLSRTCFDQWKEGIIEDASPPSWEFMKKTSWGDSFLEN